MAKSSTQIIDKIQNVYTSKCECTELRIHIVYFSCILATFLKLLHFSFQKRRENQGQCWNDLAKRLIQR